MASIAVPIHVHFVSAIRNPGATRTKVTLKVSNYATPGVLVSNQGEAVLSFECDSGVHGTAFEALAAGTSGTLTLSIP